MDPRSQDTWAYGTRYTPRRRSRRFSFIAAVTAFALVIGSGAALGAVSTDQQDYAPGSVVTISGDNSNGAGYLAGETVAVDVTGPNGYTAYCEGTADENGSWSCQVTLWDSLDAVGDYAYTATGQTSGAVESGAFSDAASTAITGGTTGWLKNGSIGGGTGFNVVVSGAYVCNTTGAPAVRCVTPTAVRVEIYSSNGVNNTVSGSPIATKSATPSSGAFTTTFEFRTSPGGGHFAIPSDQQFDIKATLVATIGTPGVAGTDAPNADIEDNRAGVDNTAPTSAVSTVTPAGASVDATGTASDPAGGSGLNTGTPKPVAVEIRIGSSGGATVAGTATTLNATGGTWAYSTASGPTAPGTYCVVSQATDIAGNVQSGFGSSCYTIVPPNTPPTVTVNGVTNGGSYEIGSVPAATCDVTDTEDGNSSFAATLSAITGPLAGIGLGSQTASCSYTDGGGLSATASKTYSIVDTGSPSNVSIDINSGAAWTNSTGVTLHIHGEDAVGVTGYYVTNGGTPTCLAASLASYTAVTSTTSYDDAALAHTLTSTQGTKTVCVVFRDASGNKTAAEDTIGLDTIAPTITDDGVSAGTAGNAGWYISAVTNDFSATDGGSGLSAACDADFPKSVGTGTAEGSAVTVASGSCTDVAGNTAASIDSAAFMIDLTNPLITDDGVSAGTAGNAGWYISAVTNDFSASDGGSGLSAACDADFPKSVSTGTAEGSAVTVASGSCTDVAGNTAASIDSALFMIDLTNPLISHTVLPASPNGDNGWYVSAPTVTFDCSDSPSGIFSCLAFGEFTNQKTLGESSTGQTVNGTATDVAGRTSTDSAGPYYVDLSDPTDVAFVGGPSSGGSYYFGSVPAEPTCTAEDAISGLDACVVTGYSTLVGTHTMTATATDMAGRTATATRTYTVLAWTINGFYAPVDKPNTMNVTKNGSTVPLKFEVFAGPTELTDIAIVKVFATNMVCSSGVPMDSIEEYATGGTSLRYDTTGGQFIFNWKTPKQPNTCWRVRMETQDGSFTSANFNLK